MAGRYLGEVGRVPTRDADAMAEILETTCGLDPSHSKVFDGVENIGDVKQKVYDYFERHGGAATSATKVRPESRHARACCCGRASSHLSALYRRRCPVQIFFCNHQVLFLAAYLRICPSRRTGSGRRTRRSGTRMATSWTGRNFEGLRLTKFRCRRSWGSSSKISWVWRRYTPTIRKVVRRLTICLTRGMSFAPGKKEKDPRLWGSSTLREASRHAQGGESLDDSDFYVSRAFLFLPRPFPRPKTYLGRDSRRGRFSCY